MDDTRRRLLWHGMFLFLLGLVTGLVETKFSNVRMGLVAHLEGVMNGTFLVAAGAIWLEVRLAPGWKAAACWTLLYGTYANWLFTLLAAVFGTGALSPVTAPGLVAAPRQENLVTGGLMSCGVAIIAATVLMLWGLRGKAAT